MLTVDQIHRIRELYYEQGITENLTQKKRIFQCVSDFLRLCKCQTTGQITALQQNLFQGIIKRYSILIYSGAVCSA